MKPVPIVVGEACFVTGHMPRGGVLDETWGLQSDLFTVVDCGGGGAVRRVVPNCRWTGFSRDLMFEIERRLSI